MITCTALRWGAPGQPLTPAVDFTLEKGSLTGIIGANGTGKSSLLKVIAGLQKRRKGDGHTEVAALGALMSGPCPACKKSNWVAEMLYVDTGTMGWRALGEKSFDSIPAGGP